jgi:alpha-beta hydrolase superfamily lysophospholipase
LWNGKLIVNAHGTYFDPYPLGQATKFQRSNDDELLLEEGYAMAGVQYSASRYEVDSAVAHVLGAINRFVEHAGRAPDRIMLHGFSYGSAVALKTSETAPEGTIHGVLVTSPLGDGLLGSGLLATFRDAFRAAFGNNTALTLDYLFGRALQVSASPAGFGWDENTTIYQPTVYRLFATLITDPRTRPGMRFIQEMLQQTNEEAFMGPSSITDPNVLLALNNLPGVFLLAQYITVMEGKLRDQIGCAQGAFIFSAAGSSAQTYVLPPRLVADAASLNAEFTAATDFYGPSVTVSTLIADMNTWKETATKCVGVDLAVLQNTLTDTAPVPTIYSPQTADAIAHPQGVELYLKKKQAAGLENILVVPATGLQHEVYYPTRHYYTLVHALDDWIESSNVPSLALFTTALGFNVSARCGEEYQANFPFPAYTTTVCTTPGSVPCRVNAPVDLTCPVFI